MARAVRRVRASSSTASARAAEVIGHVLQVEAPGRAQHRRRMQTVDVRVDELAEGFVYALGAPEQEAQEEPLGRNEGGGSHRPRQGSGFGPVPPQGTQRPAAPAQGAPKLLAGGRLVEAAALGDPGQPGRALHGAVDLHEHGQERFQIRRLARGRARLVLGGRPADHPLHGLRGRIEALRVGAAPLLLQERVGVVARGQLHHVHAQALLHEHVQALPCRLLPRVVLVEVHHDLLGKAPQESPVERREGRAAGGHGGLHPRLEGAGHVEIALHQHDPPLLPDGVLGPGEAVEGTALRVDRGLGRVQVLGLAAVEAPRAEGHDLAALVQDGKDGPPPEAVVVSALVLALEDEARGEEDRGREPVLERVQEVVPALAGRSRADALEGLLLEPAAQEVLAGLRAGSGPERPGEVLARRLHQGQDLLALLAVGADLGAPLGHRDAVAAGQGLHGLGEIHPLVEHHELEDVAPRPTAEAVEDRRLGAHVEGRRLLVVEGTEALPGVAHLLEGHLLGDHAHHVGGAADFFDEGIREGHG